MRILALIALPLAGCADSGDHHCVRDIPFSIDISIDRLYADDLAAELEVPRIDGMCEAVCRLVAHVRGADEEGRPFYADIVDSCTLVAPSPRDSVGSLRCEGIGDRCIMIK